MNVSVKNRLMQPQDVTGFIARHADIGIGLILLAVLALLVIPMPIVVLDAAIALNFCFAMLLLAAAVYVRTPLDLTTFPSLLLLTTLFRLGLAVATTKMILLHAFAGDIIQTFGHLVVGGNVVVGLVIFAVLCAVQFIVVAKGSDRIAEVSARFTLDAIPGKQMSIDAELRAGTLTSEQAKHRRETLQQEIQLHGALDGAMKFVKGDAIVGLIIALVNIIGGIVIGTAMRGMPVSEAMTTYVILTVGDGLVSQIPSLIVAISAGLVITRGETIGSEEGQAGDNLGSRIFGQLANRPRPVLMAAAGACVLALVPGFPHLAFLGIAAVLVLIGLATRKREVRIAQSRHAPMRNMTKDGAHYVMNILDSIEMGTMPPLCIRIGEEAFRSLNPGEFDEELGSLREHLTQELGVPFPGLSMKGEGGYTPTLYRIEVDAEQVAEGHLYAGRVFVVGAETLLAEDARDMPALIPGLGQGYWIDAEQAPPLREQGAWDYGANQVLAEHLHHVCKQYAKSFVGTQETRYLLDRLGMLFPDVVESVAGSIPPSTLAHLLRELLGEGVSIRNLRAICEAIARLKPNEQVGWLMLRHARIALGRQIVRSVTDPESGALQIVLLDDELTQFLQGTLQLSSAGEPQLVLDPRQLKQMDATFRPVAASVPPRAVLVTSAALRPHVADLLRGVSSSMPTLAMEEIPFGEIAVQRVGTVVLADEVTV
jgi:type III secretion protein V